MALTLNKKITCLFCFEQFAPSEVEFRCINRRCSGQTEDHIYADAQGLAVQRMGPVFSAPPIKMGRFRVIRQADCPHCARECFTRICPSCHYDLPRDAGLIDARIIAVVGGRGTGKSNYIATLIQRMKNEIGDNLHAAVHAIDDRSGDRYERDFYTPLYRRGQIIPATPTASLDIRTRTPMVFRITFASGRKNKAINLTLFDTAGEDLQSLNSMSAEARYIYHADAVIFLLDPLQFDSVRQRLQPIYDKDPNLILPPPDPGAEPYAILRRLRGLYEQFGFKPNAKLKKPIAFALSKIDALFPIIDPGSGLRHTGEHFEKLNVADLESIHTQVNAYLHHWEGPQFDNFVSTHFQNYRYFGVSAFGKSPKPDNTIDGVAPIRVEDPLLWIAKEFGLIGVISEE
jgi:hypothetical protein